MALHFGRQNGGELVRTVHGRPEARLAREPVREAFRLTPTVQVAIVIGAGA
jgi:hypothetical protein